MISIRYLAHASIQILTETENIYIDPSTKDTGLRIDDFAPSDLILVTHSHNDHCDPKLVKKIRKGGKPIMAPESCRKDLEKAGTLWTLQPGEFMQMCSGNHIKGVPAYNIKRTRPSGEPYHPKGSGMGFLLTIKGKRIYYAGDTDLIPEMTQLGEIDVALLPIGDIYTMDIEEASEVVKIIKPKVVIPIHERASDPKAFKENVERNTSTQVVILQKGGEYKLD